MSNADCTPGREPRSVPAILLLQSICGTINSSQQTSMQCFSTINMVFSNADKILIEFVFEGVHSKELDKRISLQKLDKA